MPPGDHVLDTNVLLVASAGDPTSPFKDSPHVPPAEQRTVLEWLREFRRDPSRHLVLDSQKEVMREYKRKLGKNDYGYQVFIEKLQAARFHRMVPGEVRGDAEEVSSTDFFKFPHTPHLVWLSSASARQDKVLSPPEVRDFLSAEVLVEEKVDGANLGISVDPSGNLRAQNRGSFLGTRASPQFQPLWPWLEARRERLVEALGQSLILFGEWCFAVHSIRYDALPDWFLAFDVYDRDASRFWSAERRDALVERLGLSRVPVLARGGFTLTEVQKLLGSSQLVSGLMEGLYLRRDRGGFLEARAKLVRPEFVQAIEEHWSSRPLERNALTPGARV